MNADTPLIRTAAVASAVALVALLLPAVAPAARPPTTAPSAGVEFFESHIRPVLVDRCYKCHSATSEKLKGGLLLDTRDGLLKGGDNGPAIVPGDPDASLLVRAIRRTDADLRMPPKEPLTKEQAAAFELWVRMGAPDPRSGPATPAAADARRHWALQPVRPVTTPAVRDKSWPANDIDRFVLAKLEESGLHPSPPAGKRELLRRVTFDLTGLPPTPDEVEAFLADESAQAFAKVVDRLLASPRYGERWGRYWLDVVRFGESHGYEQNHLRDRAWPYRDYVIRAFNEDKPYRKFVEEQLAGEPKDEGERQKDEGRAARPLPASAFSLPPSSLESAATGFLVAGVHDTVGNNAEAAKRQQRADDLDDIVSTVGATFLGLTVGCAKCHDHKFDPVPQADYYAFCAVFAGVRHDEGPLLGAASPERQREAQAVADRVRAVDAEIKQIETHGRQAALNDERGAGGAAAVTRQAVSARRNVDDFAPVPAKFVRFTVLATRDGAEPCLDELEVYALDGGPNLALASAGATATASSLLPGYKIHQIAHLNDGQYGNDHSWVGSERGAGWAQIELPRESTVARVVWSRDNVDPPKYDDRLATKYRVDVSTDGKTWKAVATGDDRAAAPEAIPGDRVTAALTPDERRRRDDLRIERDKLAKQAAALATTAYVGKFTTPDPIYLLKRGDVMQRGDLMAPAGLSRIPGLPAALNLDPAAPESARRLALARWICDGRNPLTARVMVNRVWQYHFGRGLVGTPSDFGANGEPPSHPELLDWLATDFVNGGWTLKRLHRQIVLSRTYQQAGGPTELAEVRPDDAAFAAGLKADGGNRLLWRMPLRRLEAEAVRDSILATSGKLDLSPAAVGGPGFRLFQYKVVNIALYDALPDPGPETWRRAVFQQTARNIHDDLMAAFDEPENAQRSPRREVTTNPLQALTLMNSLFVRRQAAYFADRVRAEAGADAGGDVGAQVDRAFRLALGRPPTADERAAAAALVGRYGLPALCRGLFNTNEFLTY